MTIGIGVILRQHAEQAELGPGERRLLHAIAEDPRLNLLLVSQAPAASDTPSGAVARALALEARAFPAPDRAESASPEIVPLPAALPEGCDVVVDFSHSEAALRLGTAAPEGLWRLSCYAPGAGHGEARDRAAVTRVTLTRTRAGGETETLDVARYDTKFLATRNATLAREKSVQLVTRALARLAHTGAASGEARSENGGETGGENGSETGGEAAEAVPVRRFTAGDLPGYGFRSFRELFTRALHAAGERVGFRPGMFELRLGHGDGLSFDPAVTVPLTPPKGSYWADPFLFEHAGTLYLFYEVYDYKTRRGHLGVGRVEGDRLVPLGDVLKRPYHLSYPFVFSWKGEIWMLPETCGASQLELWRATDFPFGWELETTALEGVVAADSVLHEQAGQWWLFTNICRDSAGDHGAELHLFRVDSPMMNRLEPHPLNPVVIDTTTARGGGRVFARDGKLYRSSQDNSHGLYGFGLNLMQITRLDMEGYAEERVRHVTGDFAPGLMGCHHMDAAAGRFVIDVRRRTLGAPKG
ncbi:MAG: hypothetical protein CSA74_09405 [Rhodobacterales bacterium]|nr:MAG: hypothetical protein CSA74_09405 [Rhodobacterales bacterium]